MPTQRPHTTASRIAAAALLTAGFLAVLLALPGVSRAGVYVAVQCAAASNVAAPDAVFARTSDHYVPGDACGGGAGKLVSHQGATTKAGRGGVWGWYSPPGTVFTQITAQSHVVHDAGHKANYLIVDGAGNTHTRWPREGVWDAVDWAAGTDATQFLAWLSCWTDPCGASGAAHNYVRGLWFTLRDHSPPALSLNGDLTTPGVKRGVQGIAGNASDVGGGVWTWRVTVNGTSVGSATQSCDIIPGGAARRFVPCPSSAYQAFHLDTEKAPFRNGENTVVLCVGDVGWPANETCRTQTVHVENLCPASGTHAADGLDVGFADGRAETTVDSNRQAKVQGRVRGAGAGARVCVFSTPLLPGAGETLEAQPSADGDGRFEYAPARGPSRRLRFVYRWRARQAEAELTLRVRARPRLKVGPRSRLRNGQVARFRGKLPGPGAGGRVVVLQARVGKRWQAFKTARTLDDGRFAARYRFRGTTGRRLYRFRAVVREQAGYPYEKGTSPIRRVVVRP